MTVGTGLASLNIQGNAQNAQNPQQTGTTRGGGSPAARGVQKQRHPATDRRAGEGIGSCQSCRSVQSGCRGNPGGRPHASDTPVPGIQDSWSEWRADCHQRAAATFRQHDSAASSRSSHRVFRDRRRDHHRLAAGPRFCQENGQAKRCAGLAGGHLTAGASESGGRRDCSRGRADLGRPALHDASALGTARSSATDAAVRRRSVTPGAPD